MDMENYHLNYYESEIKRWGEIDEENKVVCPHCYSSRNIRTEEYKRWITNGYNCESIEKDTCEVCGKEYTIEGYAQHKLWATTKRLTDE